MTLLPLVVAAIGGGLLAWVARDAGRAGTVIGLVGLIVVALLAALLPDASLAGVLAGEPVALDAYGRLFLVVAAVTGLGLAVLWTTLPPVSREGLEGGDRVPGPAASFLLFLGAAALAHGIASPAAALLPAAAGGLAGFVAVGRLTTGSQRALRSRVPDDALDEAEAGILSRRLGMELLRTAIGLAGAVIAVEVLVDLPAVPERQGFAAGAASLALAAAVGLRIGVVPFQNHAARLAESVNREAVPVVAVWGPALFGLAALAGLDATVIPLGLPLSVERGVIAGLGVVTIIAGGAGAFVQDDLDHVVAWTIVQDGGFVLLAFAAADPSIWGPARTWLLLLPLAKSGLLAWALATGRTFGTRSVSELRGWARQAPLLAVGLVLVTLVTIGVPGFLSFDTRLALLRGALSEPIRSLALIGSLTSLAVVARLLLFGIARRTTAVARAPDERVRRPAPDLRRRVSATARQTLDLNRAPVSAAVVVALALVAVGVSAGLFGLRGAAAADVPSALAGSGSTRPSPTFQPVPTDEPSALPSLGPSAVPSGS
jgi:formate hydrogenlyase subunit 3/multisubunit Na+/H+ antiporter MnhD subunit